MNREEVINLMSSTVEDINREIGKAQQLPEEEVEKLIAGLREQMLFVNTLVYDKLVETGVIKED